MVFREVFVIKVVRLEHCYALCMGDVLCDLLHNRVHGVACGDEVIYDHVVLRIVVTLDWITAMVCFLLAHCQQSLVHFQSDGWGDQRTRQATECDGGKLQPRLLKKSYALRYDLLGFTWLDELLEVGDSARVVRYVVSWHWAPRSVHGVCLANHTEFL